MCHQRLKKDYPALFQKKFKNAIKTEHWKKPIITYNI